MMLALRLFGAAAFTESTVELNVRLPLAVVTKLVSSAKVTAPL